MKFEIIYKYVYYILINTYFLNNSNIFWVNGNWSTKITKNKDRCSQKDDKRALKLR